MIVTLDMAKQQCRVADFSDDDALLAQYIVSAEEYVEKRINRPLAEVEETEMLRLAILQLVAHWYNHAEAVDSGNLSEVPYTISALLKPLTRFTRRCV